MGRIKLSVYPDGFARYENFVREVAPDRKTAETSITKLYEFLGIPMENGPYKSLRLDCFDLSVRSQDGLERYDLFTVNDLVSMTEKEFRKLRGIGKVCRAEIKEKVLAPGGLDFKKHE